MRRDSPAAKHEDSRLGAVRILPLASGLVALGAGCAVMIGWVLGSGALAQLGASSPAIRLGAGTAMAAVGGATALKSARSGSRLAALLCAGAILLAVGAIVDWSFGISLGAQRLFAAGSVGSGANFAGSPYTAVVFGLLAGALLTLDSRAVALHRVLVGCALAGTLLSGFGYVYGVSTTSTNPPVSTVSSFTGMGWPSLLVAVLLSSGIVALGIDRGLKGTLVHGGADGVFARRLLPAALLVPLALGGLNLLAYGAGIYDARNGFTLFAWSMAVAFSLLVLFAAQAVYAREAARRLAETKAADARADIDSFFAGSLDAMIIGNANGYYERVNPAFATMLGYTIAELLSRPINSLLHPDDAAVSRQRESDLHAGRAVPPMETRYRRKDGSYRWILWTVPPADSRRLTYAIGKDVTERREMEDRLRASEQQAHEASRLKSEFVASMSHELRTPLNGVLGLTDLLAHTSLDSVQSNFVEGLELSGRALLAVIGDVLDFSKMEAGQLLLDSMPFDLRAAIEDATQMLGEQAHAKSLEINQWVDADVPERVNGDSARLRQILLNLLSNAVKFTATGEVTLRVTRDGGDRLLFTVADTGIGIDETKAAGLFEAFTQADQSTSRRYGGTGLGLAIARRLVNLMAGEIGAKPREGGGSVFWFTADMPAVTGGAREISAPVDPDARRTGVADDNETNPTITSHAAELQRAILEAISNPSTTQEPVPAAERSSAAHDHSVLLAEDNEINITVAEGLLHAMGLQTTIAHDGREAVELSACNEYDAIFMDIQMPNLDGYDATRQIRSLERDRRVPVIAMTAYALDGDRERALEAGMDDHIAKPLERADVAAVVERWVRAREQPQGTTHLAGEDRANGVGLSPVGDNGILDQARIRSLRATLTAQQRLTIVDTFDRQSTDYISAIGDAIRDRDADAVRSVTHKLKGTSASLGAIALASCTQQLSDSIEMDDPELNTAQLSAVRATGAQAAAALRQQLID